MEHNPNDSQQHLSSTKLYSSDPQSTNRDLN